MKRFALSLLLLAIVFAVPSFAENKTLLNVHVNQPVAIPGRLLLPGDYIFRLDDSGSGLRTVAVSSADSKTVYGFIPVYATHRESGYGDEIRATKSEAAGLTRIDSWYFPGELQGYRFIYSKKDKVKAESNSATVKAKGNQSGL